MEELEKFYNLAEPLQDAILSEKTSMVGYALGEKNGLHEDKIQKMGELIKKILMKEVPLSDFNMELELRTGLNPEKVEEIAKEINKEILNPVKIFILKKEESQFVGQKDVSQPFIKQKNVFDEQI